MKKEKKQIVLYCWTSAMNKPITDTKYPYIHIFKKIGGQTE